MLVIELRDLCAIKLYFQFIIIIIITMIKTSETHVSQYCSYTLYSPRLRPVWVP